MIITNKILTQSFTIVNTPKEWDNNRISCEFNERVDEELVKFNEIKLGKIDMVCLHSIENINSLIISLFAMFV